MRLREIGPPAIALVLGAATTFGIGMLVLPAPDSARPATDAGAATAATNPTAAPFEPGATETADEVERESSDAGSSPSWPITTGGRAGQAATDDSVPAPGSDDDDGDDEQAGDAGAIAEALPAARPAWAAPTGPGTTSFRAEVGELSYVRCSSGDAGRPTPGERCGRLTPVERRVTQLLARDGGRCVRAIEPEADALRLALEVRFDQGSVRVWAGQASTIQGVGAVVHCMRRVLLAGPEGTPRFALDGIDHREDRYTMFVALRFVARESSPDAGHPQRSAPSSRQR